MSITAQLETVSKILECQNVIVSDLLRTERNTSEYLGPGYYYMAPSTGYIRKITQIIKESELETDILLIESTNTEFHMVELAQVNAGLKIVELEANEKARKERLLRDNIRLQEQTLRAQEKVVSSQNALINKEIRKSMNSAKNIHGTGYYVVSNTNISCTFLGTSKRKCAARATHYYNGSQFKKM